MITARALASRAYRTHPRVTAPTPGARAQGSIVVRGPTMQFGMAPGYRTTIEPA